MPVTPGHHLNLYLLHQGKTPCRKYKQVTPSELGIITTWHERILRWNPHITLKEDRESTTFEETIVSDIDTLTQYDFSAEQIVSLLRLRQRYQTGGSDRVAVIRHWEFLKLLVTSGRLEA